MDKKTAVCNLYTCKCVCFVCVCVCVSCVCVCVCLSVCLSMCLLGWSFKFNCFETLIKRLSYYLEVMNTFYFFILKSLTPRNFLFEVLLASLLTIGFYCPSI